VNIREAHTSDWDAIWPVFKDIARAGETYGFATDITKKEAEHVWMTAVRQTYIAEEDGKVLGTYYLKTNFAGPGRHVCNCGYMVSPDARGKGLATALCEHSQRIAVELGYKAMQFNYVASSNTGAVRLWKKLGYSVVGTLPRAFSHPEQGLVDALVMYKWLEI